MAKFIIKITVEDTNNVFYYLKGGSVALNKENILDNECYASAKAAKAVITKLDKQNKNDVDSETVALESRKANGLPLYKRTFSRETYEVIEIN